MRTPSKIARSPWWNMVALASLALGCQNPDDGPKPMVLPAHPRLNLRPVTDQENQPAPPAVEPKPTATPPKLSPVPPTPMPPADR